MLSTVLCPPPLFIGCIPGSVASGQIINLVLGHLRQIMGQTWLKAEDGQRKDTRLKLEDFVDMRDVKFVQ